MVPFKSTHIRDVLRAIASFHEAALNHLYISFIHYLPSFRDFSQNFMGSFSAQVTPFHQFHKNWISKLCNPASTNNRQLSKVTVKTLPLPTLIVEETRNTTAVQLQTETKPTGYGQPSFKLEHATIHFISLNHSIFNSLEDAAHFPLELCSHMEGIP